MNNQPPNPPFTNQAPPPRAKWPWLTALLFLILGLVLGAAGYRWFIRNSTAVLFSPPPAIEETGTQLPPAVNEVDTSNWQTYRNEEYGFEFRYPAAMIDNRQPIFFETDPGDPIINRPQVARLDLYAKNYPDTGHGTHPLIYMEILEEHPENTAQRVFRPSHLPFEHQLILYQAPHSYYIVLGLPGGRTLGTVSDDSEMISLYHQILSTFKFIK